MLTVMFIDFDMRVGGARMIRKFVEKKISNYLYLKTTQIKNFCAE